MKTRALSVNISNELLAKLDALVSRYPFAKRHAVHLIALRIGLDELTRNPERVREEEPEAAEAEATGRGWLDMALEACEYLEDLRALDHFVFHQRYNGASNTCLLCQYGVDWEHKESGHHPDCVYPKVWGEVKDRKLEDWARKQ